MLRKKMVVNTFKRIRKVQIELNVEKISRKTKGSTFMRKVKDFRHREINIEIVYNICKYTDNK